MYPYCGPELFCKYILSTEFEILSDWKFSHDIYIRFDFSYPFLCLAIFVGPLFTYMFMFIYTTGPEYGTMASGWKGVLTEAESMAEIHLRIKDNLIQEVESKIATWKKEHYKKSAIGPCKGTKILDDDFKKVRGKLDFQFYS